MVYESAVTATIVRLCICIITIAQKYNEKMCGLIVLSIMAV